MVMATQATDATERSLNLCHTRLPLTNPISVVLPSYQCYKAFGLAISHTRLHVAKFDKSTALCRMSKAFLNPD
jgi:hypothetical protein